MDDAELQLRLSACRPGGRDAEDPLLREALEQLPHRPQLADWFEREQAFDAAVAAQLGRVPVPERLQAEILAAAHVTTALPRWQRLPWLATAAAVVLAAVLSVIFIGPAEEVSLAQLETDIVGLFDRMQADGYGLEQVSGELTQVSAWLGAQGAPCPYVIQPGTKTARPLGCRLVSWRGRTVTMVCFARGDQQAHLFVVERDSVRDLPGKAATCEVQRVEDYPVAVWSCRKYVYLLVGDSPQTRLDDFL